MIRNEVKGIVAGLTILAGALAIAKVLGLPIDWLLVVSPLWGTWIVVIVFLILLAIKESYFD
jgi:hypothetical protein